MPIIFLVLFFTSILGLSSCSNSGTSNGALLTPDSISPSFVIPPRRSRPARPATGPRTPQPEFHTRPLMPELSDDPDAAVATENPDDPDAAVATENPDDPDVNIVDGINLDDLQEDIRDVDDFLRRRGQGAGPQQYNETNQQQQETNDGEDNIPTDEMSIVE